MNKATKLLMSSMIFSLLIASVAFAQEITPISEARGMDGMSVTIEGIMNTPDYGFNDGQFYVQDATAGINIFYNDVGGANNSTSPSFTGWSIGDTLVITGTIGSFREQIQILPDTVIVKGNAGRPMPIRISTADLTPDSDKQGMIVKIEDVQLAEGQTWPADAQTSSGVNVNVVSGDSSFVLRIDRDESFFDGAPSPTERFNLMGVMARNNSEVQIMPFDSLDIANIVSVTFNVNTATHPDTLMTDHYLAVFGGVNSPTGTSNPYLGQTIDWNSSTSLVADNQGGDYWSVTFDMAAGDEINYKWWAGVDANTGLVNGSETGWESGGNNYFKLPADASENLTTDLQWYETRTAPYESVEDSVVVLFRVNVGNQVQTGVLDPEVDKVGIRGTPNFFDNPSDWSSSAFYLENIGGSGDNVFYGGYTMVHKDSAANIGTAEYKFVIENSDGTTWEDGNNTVFTVPTSDSTTYWKFFSGVAPTQEEIVDTKLNFEVNVGILEGIGFFNSAIDTVFIRGTFNGWSTDNQMSFDDLSGKYVASNLDRTAAVGAEEKYKYYIKWDSRRDSAESDFYLAGITHDGSGWEEPGVTGGADRVMVIENAASQPVRSESFNGVEPQALMTPGNVEGGAITVTFNVDMSPAATRDDGTTPFDASTDSVFLFVDTPFFALTNDIIVPGDGGDQFINQTDEQRDRIRFTDEDGDMIYTLDLPLMLPTLNHIGFRIAYGEPTAENGEIIINGGGFDAGRRHYQYVQPMVAADGDDLDNLPDVTWPSTFVMPTLTWQKDDLPWDAPPDYSTITVSSELEGDNANRFVLNQNYPNPFNPSTNISFNLPQAADVKLTVYNVLGQEVATLLNNKTLNSGTHTVAFDASALSSGMYIYRIEAGSFVSTKRMMLIK